MEVAPPAGERNLSGSGELLYNAQPVSLPLQEMPCKQTQHVRLAIPTYYYGQVEFAQSEVEGANWAKAEALLKASDKAGQLAALASKVGHGVDEQLRAVAQAFQDSEDQETAIRTTNRQFKSILAPLEKSRNLVVDLEADTVTASEISAETTDDARPRLALLADYEAAELYEQSWLKPMAPWRHDHLPFADKIDGLYADLIQQQLILEQPLNKNLLDYLLPYQWSLVGIAYNVDYMPSAPRSWGSIFEPQSTDLQAGHLRLLGEDWMQIKSAMTYLDGKLTAAADLLDVEVQNRKASNSTPEEIAMVESVHDELVRYRAGAGDLTALQDVIVNLVAFLRAMSDTTGAASPTPAPAAIPAVAPAGNPSLPEQAASIYQKLKDYSENGATRLDLEQERSKDLAGALDMMLLRLQSILAGSGTLDPLNYDYQKLDPFGSIDPNETAHTPMTSTASVLFWSLQAARYAPPSPRPPLLPLPTTVQSTPEQEQMLNDYLNGGNPGVDADRSQAVRGALALLLSYVQYLPDVPKLQQAFTQNAQDARGSVKDSGNADWTAGTAPPALNPPSIRHLAAVGAAMNLLRRQSVLLCGQSELYSNYGAVALRDDAASLIEVRSTRAAELVLASGARRPKHLVQYSLPVEGTSGSIYHLAWLNSPADHAALVQSKTAGGNSSQVPQLPFAAENPQADPSEPDRACLMVCNYLLRPDIAGNVSSLFLYATTEGDAQAFVKRDVLNGPSYALPQQGELSLLYLAWDKASILKRAANIVHADWQQASDDYQRDGSTAPPRFPLGINFPSSFSNVELSIQDLRRR